MCLVYYNYCPQCQYAKRNYRRWPKFCQATKCIRLEKKDYYDLPSKCPDSDCKEGECGIVIRSKELICPPCREEIKWKKWLDSAHAARILAEQEKNTNDTNHGL